MKRAARCLIFLGCAWFVTGCGSGNNSEKKVAVSGTVSLDGKELPKGEVSFENEGKVPVTLEITNGTFSGDVHPGKNKVTFGVYREVKIRPMPDLPEEISRENILPAKYHGESAFEENVPGEGSSALAYKLTSK